MIKEIRDILARSPKALVQDAAGIASIGVMMIVALYLPTLF
jgi:hypothetical protein